MLNKIINKGTFKRKGLLGLEINIRDRILLNLIRKIKETDYGNEYEYS